MKILLIQPHTGKKRPNLVMELSAKLPAQPNLTLQQLSAICPEDSEIEAIELQLKYKEQYEKDKERLKFLEYKKSKINILIDAIVDQLQGFLVTEGKVDNVTVQSVGGFDVGCIMVKNEKENFELTFCNEYMTLEKDGERIA